MELFIFGFVAGGAVCVALYHRYLKRHPEKLKRMAAQAESAGHFG